MKRFYRLLLVVGLLGISALLVALAWRWSKTPDPRFQAGQALYSGNVALKARMVGHDLDLPPAAVRCANCHSQQGLPTPVSVRASASAPSAGPSDTFGSPLSARALLESWPRRGGPASRYELHAFCRVLRDGIDPASVMISQTMPRYRVADQECRDLWTFLTTE